MDATQTNEVDQKAGAKQAEQAAKDAEKAAKAAEKQRQAEAKEAERAAKAAEREAAKAKKLADKEAAKQAKNAAKLAAVEAKKAEAAKKREEKEAAKAAEKAAKEANRQPEANGVRRPKPDTKCGQAWAVFDELSAKNGTPASITDAMPIAKDRGLNEGNVRAEYARWKTFFGLSGRILPVAKTVPADATPAAAE